MCFVESLFSHFYKHEIFTSLATFWIRFGNQFNGSNGNIVRVVELIKMFSGNLKIENALGVINSIEDGKFLLLLSKIAQSLSENCTKTFTEFEETQLEKKLGKTKLEIELLTEGISEIFYICAYHTIKPASVVDHLQKDLSLSPEKAEQFGKVWMATAKQIISYLKQKSYLPQLHNISYTLSIQASSESAFGEKSAKAQLQLGLTSSSGNEDINLEFTNEELYELFKDLEKIQSQLDSVHGN